MATHRIILTTSQVMTLSDLLQEEIRIASKTRDDEDDAEYLYDIEPIYEMLKEILDREYSKNIGTA